MVLIRYVFLRNWDSYKGIKRSGTKNQSVECYSPKSLIIIYKIRL